MCVGGGGGAIKSRCSEKGLFWHNRTHVHAHHTRANENHVIPRKLSLCVTSWVLTKTRRNRGAESKVTDRPDESPPARDDSRHQNMLRPRLCSQAQIHYTKLQQVQVTAPVQQIKHTHRGRRGQHGKLVHLQVPIPLNLSEILHNQC